MATFVSGNGGSILVGAVTLNVGKWSVRKTARLAENTHSGTAASNFEKVIPHYEWTLEIPWDSDNIPDVDAGLAEGSKVTIVFTVGNSIKTLTLTNTSVETLEEVDDNANDIVRMTASGKGGTLTREVT